MNQGEQQGMYGMFVRIAELQAENAALKAELADLQKAHKVACDEMSEQHTTIADIDRKIVESDPLYQEGFRAGMLAAADLAQKLGQREDYGGYYIATDIREAAK